MINTGAPFADPSYTAVVVHFEDELARGEALAAEQVAGLIAEREAVKLQAEVRDILQGDMLRHLVTVGEAAAKENTDLRGKFRLSDSNATSPAFRTLTRAMVTEAQAQADLLGRFGLGAAFLGDLTETVTKLEGANNAARAGHLAHVSAARDLDAVTGGISTPVAVLDGIHRYRSATNPRCRWRGTVPGTSSGRSAPRPPRPRSKEVPYRLRNRPISPSRRCLLSRRGRLR